MTWRFTPLGSSAILADQAAEDLPALDSGSDIDGAACLQRSLLLQALMWPISVVVPGVLGQDLTEMPLAEDRHVVQALAAQRAREPLGECVRPRRPDRGLDHPRAVPGEDAVECGGELAVPVTNQELDSPARSPRSMNRFRACWTVQGPAG